MNESSKHRERNKKKETGFILGRAAMEKISAVEGIVYWDEMKSASQAHVGRAETIRALVRKGRRLVKNSSGRDEF